MFRIKEKFIAWLKIIRLQFYPMTFIAYSLGTVAACRTFNHFNLGAYWMGYACLFLIEVVSVLTNEYYDYSTDCINKNAGIFTGGSRVLVEGRLSFDEIKKGRYLFLCLIFIVGFFLILMNKTFLFPILALLLIGLFLGLGYTGIPFKFVYRGLGEIVVSLTHSPYVMLCGYVFQGGNWNSPLPWLLSMPLFFAVLASIILAGIPDYLADKAVSKKTIAVIFGPRIAAIMALCCTLLAAIFGISLWYFLIIKGLFGSLIFIVVPHAAINAIIILKFIKAANYDKKIDMIMQSALSYVIWFGIIPLVYFLRG